MVFKTTLRTISCVVLCLSVSINVLFISGCKQNTIGASGKEASVARTFRMNLGTEPPSLDPVQVTDLTSYTVVLNLMRGLTRFGQGQEILPDMAERWEVSADGLTYTFHLRQNTAWSDGQPVTAHDFVYGWQRALDPTSAADYAFFLFEIKNGRAYYEGKLKNFSAVGVQALNDYTLKVTLERPVAFFLGLMAAPIALPMRKDMIEAHGAGFTEAGRYISNGPFQLAQWNHEERILVKPNPHYFQPPAGIDAVEMLMVNDANTSVVMYENNELDFIETTTSIPSFDVRRLRNFPEARQGDLHRINYVGFNIHKAPFDNPKVRKAFAYALDRSYYPRLLQSGEKALSGFLTPGLIGFDPNVGIKFDPKKAKQLLAEAGYPNGKNFPTVNLAYVTHYSVQKEAEIAQYLWKKYLNVDVRLENMEWKVFLSQLNENPPHLFRLGWFVDYPDPDSFMALFISDNGNNNTGWKNSRYDELVAQAALERDESKRIRLYHDAQQLLLTEATAVIPLYRAEKTYLINPRVTGLEINQLNLIYLDDVVINSP